MAENRSKSQGAATLLRRAASILTQNSAESEGCCARNSNMGNTVRPIEFNLPQVNKPQPLVTMNMHVTSQQGSRNISISTTTNHFALKIILCMCPWKYQDHLKPLKHLPINIWSATNITWLIPVVTSPKLPLMRSKIYPRWRTSHYFSENISRTKQDMKNRYKKLLNSFKSSLK